MKPKKRSRLASDVALLAPIPPKSKKGLRIRPAGFENLPAMKPRRSRNKNHLKFISRQPCTVCGRQPCEAHHFATLSRVPLGVEFRTSSPCPCVASTIVSFTVMVTSHRGGTKPGSIQCRLRSNFGN